ncbi:MAG: MFS transporter, partial [Actinomycetota bacterium]
MIIGTALTRAALMFALVLYVQEWLLFPLAFAMLVMGKTYAVAKSAVVPTTVDSEEELVRSNSRLSILSALSAATIGIPGVILLQLGAEWVLGLGVIVFLAAAVMGTQIPATKVAARPAAESERAELKSAGILVASSAMGFLRGGVGFVTMLLAFDLRGGINPGPVSAGVEIGHRVRESLGLVRLDLSSGGAPPWHFGVALIGVGLGGLIGSATVPRLRARIREDRILAYALIGLTAFAALAAISTGLAGAFIMAFAIALAAQGGKQAFDAIVQRDAPRANLGRTFSRYESRFQLVWVLGALIPVIIPLPARVGFILVAVSAAFVAATFWFGRTPNPAAIVADGILDDSLDRLADALPGALGRRLQERTWGRAIDRDALGGDDTNRPGTSDPVTPDRSTGGAPGPEDKTTESTTRPMPVPWQDLPDDRTTRMPTQPEETAIFPAIEQDLPRPDGIDRDGIRRPPPEPDTWPTSGR